MRRRLWLPALLAVSALGGCGMRDVARPSTPPTTTTTITTSTASAADLAANRSACGSYSDAMQLTLQLLKTTTPAPISMESRIVKDSKGGVDAAAALASGRIAAEMRRTSAALDVLDRKILAWREGTLNVVAEGAAVEESFVQAGNLCLASVG